MKKEFKQWQGVDWSHSLARPGCQDFLKCPSRRSDGLHEWRPPILNASSASLERSGNDERYTPRPQ